MVRAPVYRACLVDPYRTHLRTRRTEDPAIPVTHLLAEIQEQGYTGSANLLVRYINPRTRRGRPRRPVARKVTGLLTCRPGNLSDDQRALHDQLTGACPQMTVLADQIRAFAELLVPHEDNAGKLTVWINRTRAADLPFLHSVMVLDAMELRLLREEQARRKGEEEARAQAERDMEAITAFTTTLQRTLPPPALPVIPGLELACHYQTDSPRDVGGDFYDVFLLGGNRWAFFLGDVARAMFLGCVHAALSPVTFLAAARSHACGRGRSFADASRRLCRGR
ncbi:PP2C family protein-serine/threonine phosphatase [Streptomyces sp. NPDC002701]|uniref:PP2C family protein-serine/threonine phosphatase n=1 Tax=Streptomyces sp. NPDC002701 TaxID=3364661 RepID=UPI0036D1BCCD